VSSTGGAERSPLERMLEARSVAVVGASIKEGSLGHQMMLELERGGFAGVVQPALAVPLAEEEEPEEAGEWDRNCDSLHSP